MGTTTENTSRRRKARCFGALWSGDDVCGRGGSGDGKRIGVRFATPGRIELAVGS